MAWQPFCCKIIATQSAAINSKQRPALLDEGELTVISNVPPRDCLWLHKGEVECKLVEGARVSSGKGLGWQQLACSQRSHQCQMVGRQRQAQPSAGWGALW